MKNFVSEGKTLELAHTSAVTSGEPILIGTVLGVALQAYDADQEGVFVMEGVFTLPAVSASVIAVGGACYWDDTAKKITATVSTNKLVGYAQVAKLATETEIQIKL